MTPRILGIDPGVKGGLVLLGGGGEFLKAWPTPTVKGKVLWREVLRICRWCAQNDACAAIEEMRYFGSKEMGFNSVNTMLHNYGHYLCCMKLAGIGFAEYAPQSWQAAYSVRQQMPRRETPLSQLPKSERAKARRENSEALKLITGRIASALWPAAKAELRSLWRDGIWESALIAEYHRRRIKNEELGI